MKTVWWCIAFAVIAQAQAAEPQVLNADAHFPEGPVWHQGRLYYVEYDRHTVMTWDGEKNTVFWSQPGCGPSAVINTARGEFLPAAGDALQRAVGLVERQLPGSARELQRVCVGQQQGRRGDFQSRGKESIDSF